MTLIYGQANAPHLIRSIPVASSRRFNLAQMGHLLIAMAPKARLGRVVLDLAMEPSTATVRLIATSA